MTREEIRCLKCFKYSPHPIYPSIMVCVEDNTVISMPKEACSRYVERDFEALAKLLLERGFLYCADCRQPIYSLDELRQHAGDKVIAIIPSDEVACEESPAAD
ncbi:MAG: hypothetical protein LZ169_00675 [Thaumarchaeota archaeon]|jgi:hypothetical protein|nr:hypothetical protein [Candidatus Wolframiiraptor allenii]